MPGLMLDKSDYEDVITIQPEDSCFFCKNSGHIKRDCKKFMVWIIQISLQNGIRIIQSRSMRVTDRTEITSKPEVTTGEMIVFPDIIVKNRTLLKRLQREPE